MLESGDKLSKPAWGPWSTVGFGLIIGIVFLLIEVLVTVIFVVTTIPDPLSNSSEIIKLVSSGLFLAVSTFATTIVCLGVIFGVVKIRKGTSIAEYLSFRPVTLKTILVLLATSIVLIILSDLISVILGRPVNPDIMIEAYRTSRWVALFWVAVIIFAPGFEETFFRGFLFAGLRQSKIGVAGTIVITALGWALLHLQYDFFEIAIIFIIGIVLGIARYKTNSLWSPLIMHAFFNLAATIEVALNVNSLLN